MRSQPRPTTLFMALLTATAGCHAQSTSSWTTAAPDANELLIGLGLIAGVAALDHRFDRYAVRHGNESGADVIKTLGDALPVAGLGLAGLAWLVQRDAPEGDLAYSALTAGTAALLVSHAGKYATGRARPRDELGAGSWGEVSRADSSFPSGHAAVAWAVVTPYAKHYDAPWLYGLAALTNAGRVLGRDHWASDTVAGALIGYWIGSYAYQTQIQDSVQASGWRYRFDGARMTASMKFD